MEWMSRLLHLLDTVIGILLTCGIIFCRHVRQQSGCDSWQARRRQRWKRYWEQCGQCVSRHRRRLVHSGDLSQGQRRHFPSWAGKVSLLYQVCLRLECKQPKRLSEMKTVALWIQASGVTNGANIVKSILYIVASYLSFYYKTCRMTYFKMLAKCVPRLNRVIWVLKIQFSHFCIKLATFCYWDK